MKVPDKAEQNSLLAIQKDKVEPIPEKKAACLDDIKIALSVRSEPVSCLAHFSLDTLYFLLEKWDAALIAFQTASEFASNNPDPYFEIGKIFLLLNKIDHAKKNLDKDIALGGDSIKVSSLLKNSR